MYEDRRVSKKNDTLELYKIQNFDIVFDIVSEVQCR